MQIENNVIYGGPITPNITEGTRSLGEYCFKKLSDKGNGISLVSRTFSSLFFNCF